MHQVEVGIHDTETEGLLPMIKPDEYEAELLQVARVGLAAVKRFMELDDRTSPELVSSMHLKAKTGAAIVSSHTRYMSAVNNRALLALQMASTELLALGPGGGEE